MENRYKKQIWTAAFCAAIADPNSSIGDATTFADVAVKRCEERFPGGVNPWETGVIDKGISAEAIANEAKGGAMRSMISSAKLDQLTNDELLLIGRAYAKANASANG